MNLIYFTLMVIGIAACRMWLMYSSGVHGTFRFRWNEWENWLFIAVILFCMGIPMRNMVLIVRSKMNR